MLWIYRCFILTCCSGWYTLSYWARSFTGIIISNTWLSVPATSPRELTRFSWMSYHVLSNMILHKKLKWIRETAVQQIKIKKTECTVKHYKFYSANHTNEYHLYINIFIIIIIIIHWFWYIWSSCMHIQTAHVHLVRLHSLVHYFVGSI